MKMEVLLLYTWFAAHPWITFFIIYICIAYVYNKVFRMRKLPVLKTLLVYILLGVGAGMLLFFQVKAELPIIPGLAVAIVLMLIVRIRYMIQSIKRR